MKVGTKSILFGAHQFLIHPWFVAAAWWKLYGFPSDVRLWLAFFVHDLGYWGKTDMDGAEGETHVELGARIMHWLFDGDEITPGRIVNRELYLSIGERIDSHDENGYPLIWKRSRKWHDFCLYHSRFYAKRDGAQFSRLCVADKLAIILMPRWVYLPLARLSGEVYEYLARANDGKYKSEMKDTSSMNAWHQSMCTYVRRWVDEHKDCRPDTWTQAGSEVTCVKD